MVNYIELIFYMLLAVITIGSLQALVSLHEQESIYRRQVSGGEDEGAGDSFIISGKDSTPLKHVGDKIQSFMDAFNKLVDVANERFTHLTLGADRYTKGNVTSMRRFLLKEGEPLSSIISTPIIMEIHMITGTGSERKPVIKHVFVKNLVYDSSKGEVIISYFAPGKGYVTINVANPEEGPMHDDKDHCFFLQLVLLDYSPMVFESFEEMKANHALESAVWEHPSRYYQSLIATLQSKVVYKRFERQLEYVGEHDTFVTTFRSSIENDPMPLLAVIGEEDPESYRVMSVVIESRAPISVLNPEGNIIKGIQVTYFNHNDSTSDTFRAYTGPFAENDDGTDHGNEKNDNQRDENGGDEHDAMKKGGVEQEVRFAKYRSSTDITDENEFIEKVEDNDKKFVKVVVTRDNTFKPDALFDALDPGSDENTGKRKSKQEPIAIPESTRYGVFIFLAVVVVLSTIGYLIPKTHGDITEFPAFWYTIYFLSLAAVVLQTTALGKIVFRDGTMGGASKFSFAAGSVVALLVTSVPIIKSSHSGMSPPVVGVAIIALMEMAGSLSQPFWANHMTLDNTYAEDARLFMGFTHALLLMVTVASGLSMVLLRNLPKRDSKSIGMSSWSELLQWTKDAIFPFWAMIVFASVSAFVVYTTSSWHVKENKEEKDECNHHSCMSNYVTELGKLTKQWTEDFSILPSHGGSGEDDSTGSQEGNAVGNLEAMLGRKQEEFTSKEEDCEEVRNEKGMLSGRVFARITPLVIITLLIASSMFSYNNSNTATQPNKDQEEFAWNSSSSTKDGNTVKLRTGLALFFLLLLGFNGYHAFDTLEFSSTDLDVWCNEANEHLRRDIEGMMFTREGADGCFDEQGMLIDAMDLQKNACKHHLKSNDIMPMLIYTVYILSITFNFSLFIYEPSVVFSLIYLLFCIFHMLRWCFTESIEGDIGGFLTRFLISDRAFAFA